MKHAPHILALMLAACGNNNTSGWSSGDTLGRGGIRLAGSATAVPSAVNSPDLQKDLVVRQLEAIVQALGDGGTGAAGGGGANAGLLDAPTFLERRTCATASVDAPLTIPGADGYQLQVASGAGTVTITRTYEGMAGERAYQTPSTISEVWYAGPYFGLANIVPDASTGKTAPDYGTVPTAGIPPVPTPAAVAPAGSSGLLGSVGWRSTDGSWTGAPVWEVQTAYVAGKGASAAATTGMVMYYSASMPAVTPSTTPPTVGGAYAPTKMTSSKGAASAFEVLGKALGDGSLPSFQPGGMTLINGVPTRVNQAGTVTKPGLPAKVYDPPLTLGCDSAKANVAPGWRFSQNVAELTKVTTSSLQVTRTFAGGASTYGESGTYVTTWSDPALVPPVSSTPPSPYFDQNAGAAVYQRYLTIGLPSAPAVYTSAYTPTGGASGPVLTDSVTTSARISDTVYRNLLDPNWAWISHSVGVGTLSTTQVNGTATTPVATITTTIGNLVWINNQDPNAACVPTSGLLITDIVPADKTLQSTKVVLRFGPDIGIPAPSGVTSTVTCSGGASGAANCVAQPETDDPDYRPSGCNF